MTRPIPPNVRSLGEAVRLLREDRGITLRALAEKIGVSAPFLSDLEHGRRQTDKYDQLAEALDVDVEALRKLDPRVSQELKDWLSENPKLLHLLRDMQGSGKPVPVDELRAALKRRK